MRIEEEVFGTGGGLLIISGGAAYRESHMVLAAEPARRERE